VSITPQIPLVKVGLPPPEELMPALQEVLYSGFIAEGEPVYRFERAFGECFGLPTVLGMSSGTAALHAALVLAGVRSGDEVISTSMTAEPTNIAILHAGATPVFADVDPLSGNLDPASVRRAITDRTRAIVVVHYAGFPVRLREIIDIATARGIPVIEDCAHALGARYEGRPVGTLADYGLYSFQAIKHMTTVDGGALAIADADRAGEARRFRWFGMDKGVPRTQVDVRSVGYKYNMNNVTATIGLAQLQGIERRIARHVDNGRFFDLAIPQIPGLAVTTFDSSAEPSYWLYTVLSEEAEDVERRLAAVGVAASKLHRPNHLHSIFADSRTDLPGLDAFYRRMVHIPCGWWVGDEDRQRIVDALRKG
jgi:perosamine synthetase